MDRNLFCSEELYAWISRRCAALKSVIDQKEAALAKYPDDLPAGSIRAALNGSKHTREQFYLRQRPNDKSGKYLKKTSANRELASIMIQKEYDEKILAAATREYNYLKKAAPYSGKDTLIEVLESMGNVKQRWITPVLATSEKYADNWSATPVSPQQYNLEGLVFSTKKKELVRSKSEVLIANALFDHNIPYRYESPLIDGTTVWALPDFTILNIRLRKEYYWEHFGMMGNPDYSRKALKKIKEYEKHKIFQGREIIYTFESNEVPLDSENIETIIREYLV